MKKWISTSVFLLLAISPAARAQSVDPLDSLKMDDAGRRVAAATKEAPFVNSLGMKFVPVPGTKTLFSIWDTRVQDFRAFVTDTGHAQGGGIWVMKVVKNDKGSGDMIKWLVDKDADWINPGFKQGETYPVVGVNWDDAKAFCAWLTAKERKDGKIGHDQLYRLPTDKEWSAAVGRGKYPWGNDWPPPAGFANYADDSFVANLPGSGWKQIPGNDGFERTNPVDAFKPNRLGLFDMGGNVWQWCEDWYRADMNEQAVLDKFPDMKGDGGGHKFHVLRGATWTDYFPERILSSYRSFEVPDFRNINTGFRCVLVTTPSPD